MSERAEAGIKSQHPVIERLCGAGHIMPFLEGGADHLAHVTILIGKGYRDNAVIVWDDLLDAHRDGVRRDHDGAASCDKVHRHIGAGALVQDLWFKAGLKT